MMNALFVGGPTIKSQSRNGRDIVVIERKYIRARLADGTEVEYCIEVGSTSDMASIPQVAWSLGFAPFGDYEPAAVAHDCSYQDTLLRWDGIGWVKAHLTKQQSDDLINALMFSLGVAEWKRLIIYEALVAFGWPAFRADREIAAAKDQKA